MEESKTAEVKIKSPKKVISEEKPKNVWGQINKVEETKKPAEQ